MRYRFFALAIVSLLVGGCYHATVTDPNTPPAATRVGNSWAHSWLWGLVPPRDVEATACGAGGIQRVETQINFAQGFVSFITGGIYTPMQIDVTCGQPGGGGEDY